MRCQGHHQDGSSIQRHSAGSHYPYVVGKQEGQDLAWFVLSPEGELQRFASARGAFRYADAAAQVRG